MVLALKRPFSVELQESEMPALQKKRRMSVAEVEDALEMSGLSQPAMALLHAPCGEGGDSDCRKRGFLADSDPDAPWLKRQRPCSEDLPVQIDSHTSDTRAIVPISRRTAFGMGGPFEPVRIAVHPTGVAFVLSDHGFMVAEFTEGSRPIICLANGSTIEIGMFALDNKGKAYIWSTDGHLLAEVPACKRIANAPRADEVSVQLLSKPSLGEACPFTPSTIFAETDMEDNGHIEDCDMTD
eukprot:TRINITY_DN55942_c0_g1_i1.p1 TRINITY_DN55942_c0_g1~~TRINITY_DN55942_c0_g1_i1.p1  ORF type:complete len:258 (+),score=31.53 TRINITY_DN55942_c0_g1_i1:57-776(+)